MKFRKKPVVIEAFQWMPSMAESAFPAWFGGGRYWYDDNGKSVIIPTLEGDIRADAGDWIIRGIAGEIYPCKPDIFQATYEPVS